MRILNHLPQVMKYLLVSLIVILTAGCTGRVKKQMPASIGQPYEVVLEGDTDSILSRILTEDVPGLPQSEPLCDLILAKKGNVKGSYLMVRTRIVVDIAPQHKAFSAKMTQDVNASPQTVIHIKTKSTKQLKAMFYEMNQTANKNGERIRFLIDQSELKHLVSTIQQNPMKQREVKQMFGLNMKIPTTLNASKKAKGFLWLGNNANSGMQNLIIFRLKGNGCVAPNRWSFNLNEINKVLRLNMLGETDNIYMQLANPDNNTKIGQKQEKNENPCATERGLWEMRGDAMGGPYLLKVLPMSKGKIVTPHSNHEQPARIDSRIIVIGFVYAPEMKKRNLIKQLEAILTTIK